MGAFDVLRGQQLQHGYWGNHTSTIDWCETNYSHTPYIAEVVNTLTNLPSILIGLYGAWSIIKNGLPGRYALCYLGGTLIGLGSFGFHMSLRWEWQLMDELPMIYIVSLSSYLAFETQPGFQLRFGIWGPLVLISWCIFVTVSYAYLPNPIYHQIAFGLLLISTIGRYLVLIGRLPTPPSAASLADKDDTNESTRLLRSTRSNTKIKTKTPSSSTPPLSSLPASSTSSSPSLSPAATKLAHASQLRPKIITTMTSGILIFILGFALWNIDNFFCDHLNDFRALTRSKGLIMEVVGLMTHGHGWWHLMTGYGAFLINTSGICLQLAVKVSPDQFTYDSKAWFPVVQRVHPSPLARITDGDSDSDSDSGHEKREEVHDRAAL